MFNCFLNLLICCCFCFLLTNYKMLWNLVHIGRKVYYPCIFQVIKTTDLFLVTRTLQEQNQNTTFLSNGQHKLKVTTRILVCGICGLSCYGMTRRYGHWLCHSIVWSFQDKRISDVRSTASGICQFQCYKSTKGTAALYMLNNVTFTPLCVAPCNKTIIPWTGSCSF